MHIEFDAYFKSLGVGVIMVCTFCELPSTRLSDEHLEYASLIMIITSFKKFTINNKIS